MYRVALNTAISIYRKSKRRVATQDLENVQFKLTAEEYDDEADQQLSLMYAAIRQLNDINKALVFLYLENRNYKEIADTLGITEVNARVKMNRIKTKLTNIINP
jgi:RNA polymerase sigma-70 factor (ECF subfamily)